MQRTLTVLTGRMRRCGQALGVTLAATAGIILATIAGMTAARAAESYTFAGLDWGLSSAEASERLRAGGYTVSGPYNGPATEYAAMNAWLEVRSVDRGDRLLASGTWLGEPVEVDLVFGGNDRLERINLRTPVWDGTPDGAGKMAGLADIIVAHLEDTQGRAARKIDPFGFVDTAHWNAATDGSGLQMFVRGSDGFMFFPNHQTVLNVSLWNSRYQDGASVYASDD